VLIRTYENNDLLSQTKFRYGSFSGDIWRTEALEAKGSDGLTQRMDFISYDDLGNLKEYKQTDGASVSYIWGYDQMYPVAKVENATRAQIAGLSGFTSSFHAGSGGLSTSQENTLRNGLPNALVTTYTYRPMVGITSSKDPRGYKMTYHYDAFNRLEFVKDADGNLVSENTYNYKNN